MVTVMGRVITIPAKVTDTVMGRCSVPVDVTVMGRVITIPVMVTVPGRHGAPVGVTVTVLGRHGVPVGVRGPH